MHLPFIFVSISYIKLNGRCFCSSPPSRRQFLKFNHPVARNVDYFVFFTSSFEESETKISQLIRHLFFLFVFLFLVVWVSFFFYFFLFYGGVFYSSGMSSGLDWASWDWIQVEFITFMYVLIPFRKAWIHLLFHLAMGKRAGNPGFYIFG